MDELRGLDLKLTEVNAWRSHICLMQMTIWRVLLITVVFDQLRHAPRLIPPPTSNNRNHVISSTETRTYGKKSPGVFVSAGI